ncbi:pentapeptide repeat-containing protein [Roseovarius sp.]|jgi:uncharacterized protein YjbI with pentapeptide repeats
MERKPSRNVLDWMGISDAPDWSVARPLGALVSLLLVLLFAGALVAAFVLIGRTIVGEGGAGSTLGTGALIVALLGAPFLIWSTVLKHETVRYQKEGHITDRINKAVEQLGAEKTVKKDDKETTEPNIEVRIGAILSLERIAQDSTRYDKGRDHVRVMEILCAYIRENSNARPPVDFEEDDWERLKENPTEEERAAHLDKIEERFGILFRDPLAREWAQTLPEPRADIALALLVLGRRTVDQRLVEAAWPNPPSKDTKWVFDKRCPELPEIAQGTARDPAQIQAFQEKLTSWKQTLVDYSGYRLDLRGANLQRADLSSKRPDQSDAVFAGADLRKARLEGAVFTNTRLEGAKLWDAQMEGANLFRARLNGVDLRNAQLEGAVFGMAQMKGANLSRARMEAADLRIARMEGADLSDARMEGVDLSEARMEAAFLFRARMEGANLRNARMDATTHSTRVLLRRAAVQFVDFRETPFSSDQINTTFGDDSTKLPDGIPRPTHWPQAGLSWRDFENEYEKWLGDPDTYTPPDPEPSGAPGLADKEPPASPSPSPTR